MVFSELRGITCHMWSHNVTCQWTNPAPSPTGQYLVYLIRREGRLSSPRWLCTYQDGLPVCRQSPIQVVTGPDVEQLRWLKPACYHYTMLPPCKVTALHSQNTDISFRWRCLLIYYRCRYLMQLNVSSFVPRILKIIDRSAHVAQCACYMSPSLD